MDDLEVHALAGLLYDRFHLRKGRPPWHMAPLKTQQAFMCDARAAIAEIDRFRNALRKPAPSRPYNVEGDTR